MTPGLHGESGIGWNRRQDSRVSRDWTTAEWERMLREGLDEREVGALMRYTARGRPLGSDSFVSKIETLLGRRVRPLLSGRQKGWRKAK